MIDLKKLEPILAGYKSYFPSHWYDEQYKWEAIKHFQEHWDIEAENFGDMFKMATEKTFNLLASGYAYPRAMIINFAMADNEGTRQMFRNLFDETRDLSERVGAFQVAAENMRVKYDDGTWRKHYQNTNAISTYLWLMYPDKYYIYKYELYRDAAVELAADYRAKRDGSVDTMIGGFHMYDEICQAIQNDEELVKLIKSSLTDSCYPDPAMKTATIDVGFYLSRFFLNERASMQEEEGWFPKDYTPDLSVDEWVELLKDRSVFTISSLQIVKRLKDYGGQATCKQLSIKYGETPNFYNGGCPKMLHHYVCQYSYLYATEILCALREKAVYLTDYPYYHILSLGCGGCADLMAFERFYDENNLTTPVSYVGIDINELWKPITSQIKNYCENRNFKYQSIYEDVFDSFHQRAIASTNVIVISYLISYLYNTDQISAIDSLFADIARNVIARKERGQKLLLIINDVNSRYRGRNYFNWLKNKVEEYDFASVISTEKYFDPGALYDGQKIGTPYATKHSLFAIPLNIRRDYHAQANCKQTFQLILEVI